MRKITASDTLSLSIPERILLVEEIWDSIAAKAEMIEITDEEKKLIDQRLQAYYQNPDGTSPWEDVYKRIISK
jgi:putative addiction module component (TIGR02574 family)